MFTFHGTGCATLFRVMPPATLDFEKRPESTDTQLVLRLNGKLSLETVHSFISQLRPETAPVMVLDMSGVTFLDSAGVGALVRLFVHRKEAGNKFGLSGLTPQGVAVMQVSGLIKLLPIYATSAEALAGLA
jgi:anti-sigma B factor antagonist